MFKSIKLKLVMINVSVVGIILLLYSAGIYWHQMEEYAIKSHEVMRMVASDAASGAARPVKRPGHWFNYFYVKTDSQGNIVDTSPDPPISPDRVRALVKKSLELPETSGEIMLARGQSFRFLKAPPGDGQNLVLVFADAEMEGRSQGHLLAAFSVIGVGTLALVFFGSLFMANRALIPIQKSWDRQRKFVADASHELRTPLAVVQTNLELVLGNPEETVESQAKWLENIRAENQRMAKLVDDLLFLARADSRQEMLEMKRFLLHSALEEAVEPFKPVASGQGIDLEMHIDSPVEFNGSEARIKQLAVILIDNAIKHTPSGGRVGLELKDLGGSVDISVSDTGSGIEKEHLQKIFERFYRVDEARSRNRGGAGLGLSIADLIVKEHRGTIRVASTPGKGTTFKVTLPKV